MNKIISLDYPDPDIIRVDDIYYMLTTSMHFMPGGEILKSLDLINWEHECFVYDALEAGHGRNLDGSNNIYGQGMWAGSLRYHNSEFYVLFSTNENNVTYLYRSKSTKDKWTKSIIEGFYHDPSLLFDDDKVYIIFGNGSIEIVELQSDLKAKKIGGLHKTIISEDNPILGYEGAHAYKLNDKYYVFLIHSLADEWRRVQACYVSDNIAGPYVGKDILNYDRNYCNQGIAQGGIINSIDDKWHAVLFQDHGAVGRLPVILPFEWLDDYPVFDLNNRDDKHIGQTLVGDSNFGIQYDTPFKFAPYWQFNHIPNKDYYKLDHDLKTYEIEVSEITNNIMQAKNTLTQRMIYPSSMATVTVDGSKLNNGDKAGIAAFQGAYAYIALAKDDDQYYIEHRVKVAKDDLFQVSESENYDGKLIKRIKTNQSKVTFKVYSNFNQMADYVKFCYNDNNEFKELGDSHQLFFKMDHFTGCRYALFTYGTKQTGGKSEFTNFVYTIGE